MIGQVRNLAHLTAGPLLLGGEIQATSSLEAPFIASNIDSWTDTRTKTTPQRQKIYSGDAPNAGTAGLGFVVFELGKERDVAVENSALLC